MITTIPIRITIAMEGYDEAKATTMIVRIDHVSAVIPDKCTKNDKGTVIIGGIQVNVDKDFNNLFRAFAEHNRLRSIAPFN